MKLSNILLEDFNKFKQESEKLESELKDTYNRDDISVIWVSITTAIEVMEK